MNFWAYVHALGTCSILEQLCAYLTRAALAHWGQDLVIDSESCMEFWAGSALLLTSS